MECRWGTETKRPLLEDKTVFLVYMHLEGAQTSALITDLIALCSEKCQRQNIESELRLGTNLAYQPTSE